MLTMNVGHGQAAGFGTASVARAARAAVSGLHGDGQGSRKARCIASVTGASK